jgi:hypothetical protein
MTKTQTTKTTAKTAPKADAKTAKPAGEKAAKPVKKVATSLQPMPMAEMVKIIGSAKEFTTYIVAKGLKLFNSYPTLAEAAKAADSLQKTHKKAVLVSAIDAEKKATTIPEGVWRSAARKIGPAPALKAEELTPAAKAAKKAASPQGKRAEVLAAAEKGVLPAAPDFSAETHKRFRPKLAEVVALVEKGDVKALKAFPINPVSSSPKALAKYRDLAVIALEAKAA